MHAQKSNNITEGVLLVIVECERHVKEDKVKRCVDVSLIRNVIGAELESSGLTVQIHDRK